jgi:hypothetical protein
MPRNPKRPGTNAGNTFTRDEIDAVVQLFDTLHRGADVHVILRQEPVRKVYAKFKRMKSKLDEFARKEVLR